MDPVTLKWILAVHVYAILTWVGSLVGLSFILKQHAQANEGARADLIKLEKATAMGADIGATIAMIAGIVMIVQVPELLTKQPWMHAKLTLVAVLLGVHGFQRMRTGKYKRAQVSPEPGWVIPVLELAILGIVVLAVAKPF